MTNAERWTGYAYCNHCGWGMTEVDYLTEADFEDGCPSCQHASTYTSDGWDWVKDRLVPWKEPN